MRVIGWILRVLACVWLVSGGLRVVLAFVEARAQGPGNHLLMGTITLVLAVVTFWASGKLLDRADKAKQAVQRRTKW